MSAAALLGALESGLLMGLVALAIYLSFRVLDFPDLTADGSFTLGGAVCATLIVAGWGPLPATAAALLAGAAAGWVTGWINVRFNILHLLASMMTMIALYSVNIRIMGGPDKSLLDKDTVFSYFKFTGLKSAYLTPAVYLAILLVIKAMVDRFLQTDLGLALRATGANPRMAQANGIATGTLVMLGLALSNALVALAGALFAQSQGAADVSMGIGTLMVGLAAVIGGGALLPSRRVAYATLACILGSIVYQLAIAFALQASFLGLTASDVNLVTAVLVCLALVLPRRMRARAARRSRKPLGAAVLDPRAWFQ